MDTMCPRKVLAWLAATMVLLYSSCHAAVNVLKGELLGPLIDYKEGTSLDTMAEEVWLDLICEGVNPTEWIFNSDDFKHDADTDHTEIQFRHMPEGVGSFLAHMQSPNASYTYQANVGLSFNGRQFLFEEEVGLICRSVFNHSDNVLVKLTPAENGTELDITAHSGLALWDDDDDVKYSDPSLCNRNVTLMLSQIEGRTWAKCQYMFGASRVEQLCCGSESECVNKYRKEYRKSLPCLKMVAGDTFRIQAEEKDDWTDFSPDTLDPSVAVCVLDGDVTNLGFSTSEIRLAAPTMLSFDGPRNVGGNIDRKLHLSRYGLPMENFIWLDPPNTRQIWYTNEVLDTECVVPMYWFALHALVVVTFNWTTVIHEARLKVNGGITACNRIARGSIHVNFTGAGVYQIQCLAPVWNTTEWANHTTTLHVRDPTPPEFSEPTVHITFDEDEVNAVVVCDPDGDPAPSIITWDAGGIPDVNINEKVLTISSVSSEFENWTITCTAENAFGQRATKVYELHVRRGNPIGTAGMSTGTIVVITAGLATTLFLGIMYILYKFRKRAVMANLTNEEEKEFREGRASGNGNQDQPTGDILIECLPYNSEFEVRKEHLLVDFNMVLGSGAFGVVYKGRLRYESGEKDVAVKTVRSNASLDYFKALLSELKILAYIGHHENIVNLIGAYTENIKTRELYVGVELCDKSLLQYLRDNQHTFLKDKDTCYENQPPSPTYQNGILLDETWTFSTLDLIRWSGQIANGMEFLSEKRVVHGDLAARNVLLCFDRNVKICDFGLARQLIDYNYIKTKQCPLPWKWMAIESLTNMKFSTKSDVWAYGITLWEMFSLGRVPYAGMAWNVDFVAQLKAGLRMSRPPYADYKIFGRMTDCWNPDPNARPNFRMLKEFFRSLVPESVDGTATTGPDVVDNRVELSLA